MLINLQHDNVQKHRTLIIRVVARMDVNVKYIVYILNTDTIKLALLFLIIIINKINYYY